VTTAIYAFVKDEEKGKRICLPGLKGKELLQRSFQQRAREQLHFDSLERR